MADHVPIQRRTLNVLRIAVVQGQAAVAGSLAVVSLLVSDMLGSGRFAGVASASFTLGAAAVSIQIVATMCRRGRRPGLVSALLGGSLGAAVAAAAGQLRWFPLFLLGSGQQGTRIRLERTGLVAAA